MSIVSSVLPIPFLSLSISDALSSLSLARLLQNAQWTFTSRTSVALREASISELILPWRYLFWLSRPAHQTGTQAKEVASILSRQPLSSVQADGVATRLPKSKIYRSKISHPPHHQLQELPFRRSQPAPRRDRGRQSYKVCSLSPCFLFSSILNVPLYSRSTADKTFFRGLPLLSCLSLLASHDCSTVVTQNTIVCRPARRRISCPS